jgi:hypothetical protein
MARPGPRPARAARRRASARPARRRRPCGCGGSGLRLGFALARRGFFLEALALGGRGLLGLAARLGGDALLLLVPGEHLPLEHALGLREQVGRAAEQVVDRLQRLVDRAGDAGALLLERVGRA